MAIEKNKHLICALVVPEVYYRQIIYRNLIDNKLINELKQEIKKSKQHKQSNDSIN